MAIRTSTSHTKNNAGQGMVEAILIAVLVLGVAKLVVGTIKGEEYLAKITNGPWNSIRGVIEYGRYKKYTSADADTDHPHLWATGKVP